MIESVTTYIERYKPQIYKYTISQYFITFSVIANTAGKRLIFTVFNIKL
jgi:ABC-type transport system involved in cytochrome bd biosynthesis fused ATPase/permease subunit